MEQRVAAIDIGTHSVKMSVADGRQVLGDWVAVTRLGDGVSAVGRLDPLAKQRTRDALAHFVVTVRDLGVQRIAAVGTSALRDASDGPEFADEMSMLLGGSVEILSGDREAWLVFRAVADDPLFGLERCSGWILTDAGGGSTEVVAGAGRALSHRVSLQVGAVDSRTGFLVGVRSGRQHPLRFRAEIGRPIAGVFSGCRDSSDDCRQRRDCDQFGGTQARPVCGGIGAWDGVAG